MLILLFYGCGLLVGPSAHHIQGCQDACGSVGVTSYGIYDCFCQAKTIEPKDCTNANQ